ERGQQPVPDPRREGQDDSDLEVPDLIGPAPALARGALGAVRRRPVREALDAGGPGAPLRARRVAPPSARGNQLAGIRTRSITWMMPFRAAISVLTTFA